MKITDEIIKREIARKESWLSSQMAEILPPELFLRAYGNMACRLDVLNYLAGAGYRLEEHPDKTVLKRGEETLSTYTSSFLAGNRPRVRYPYHENYFHYEKE